ncbi:MAG: AAA family ATPase [Candidatus Methanoplasma sp.]|nr:AAA family ATPase [Candidatus Methanoplasma sp.]
MKKIAFYGKGGVGKSTTASNVSVALSESGLKVIQIGCDPKGDSTLGLRGGKKIQSVLSAISSKGGDVRLDDIVFEGYSGVLCVESGGPKPGSGCAGKGIITAFDRLESLGAYREYNPDVVLFDVLGDVVCGGFAMPIRRGYSDDVYIVTSGEMMSLYAANNISEAVRSFSGRGYAELKGLIYNPKGADGEDDAVEKASAEIGTQVAFRLERDPLVREAEKAGKTAMEMYPDSRISGLYRALAAKVRG